MPTNVVIALRADEPVDPSTVTTGSFGVWDNVLGQQIAGTTTISIDGQTLNFVPNAPLAVLRQHSVYFAWQGITDLAGNLARAPEAAWATSPSRPDRPPARAGRRWCR